MDYGKTQERIKGYMERTGCSQGAFARRAGIAESSFSKFLAGTYINMTKIANQADEFLDKEEQRCQVVSSGDLGFARTTISEKVMGVLEYCNIQRSLGVIYGDAGIGKTFTAKNWAEGRSDVYFVTVSPAFSKAKSFLRLLAKALRIEVTGTIDCQMLDILEKLSENDKMIIVDEAQCLDKKTLEIIRSINDATGTAIVLIGNEVVYSKMLGKRQAEFAQLFSRISMRNHLLTDFFNLEDMKLVFGEVEEEVAEYLLTIAQSKYGLRGATVLFTNATNNGNASVKGLKSMSRQMGIAI